MGNAANERHTFHILQRLLEAKNVSVIEDDCPNRTLLQKTLYGATFGSIMHKSDNTRIYVHIQVYSCKMDRMKPRSEEHTSELQSRLHLVCRLLLEKKKKKIKIHTYVFRYRISMIV